MITGIIYAIIDDGYFYIGSTIQSLERRLESHISSCKSAKNNSSIKSKLYKHINKVREGSWDDIIMIPLEIIECETRHELHNKELETISQFKDDPMLLNIITDKRKRYFITKRYFNNK